MLNLPHKKPVLFANKVIFKTEKSAIVEVVFPCLPNLPMFIEAAAQSSSALLDTKKEGYVLSVSETFLHVRSTNTTFNAHVKSISSTNNLNEISFEIKHEKITIASGIILLMINS